MAGEDRSSVCKTGSSGFRWLCLARSVLALVVTVLATVVLVMGLRLVLQPGTTIELNIAQSDVLVWRYELLNRTTSYGFRFYLEANNPSEVVFISYRNVTIELYTSKNEHLAGFDLDPASLFLSPKEEQEYFVYVDAANVNKDAVDKHLFESEATQSVIQGAVMVLSGELSIDNYYIKSGSNQTYRFQCEPVIVKSNAPLMEPSSGNFKVYCLKE